MLIRILGQFLVAAVIALASMADAARAVPPDALAATVARNVAGVRENVGGVAVALRLDGHSRFFNYGLADRRSPITSDLVFNLGAVGKVFDTTLMALAEERGELSLDDPVAKHVVELRQGRDIQVTLRQLATYTSGFVLPQDHPPWPKEAFTLPQFIAALNAWSADAQRAPGARRMRSACGRRGLHGRCHADAGALEGDTRQSRSPDRR
jgi:beta-lactamase class C